jgi:hypothetical protein
MGKPLSYRMQDAVNVLHEKQEAFLDASTDILGQYFDFGVECERERIIKLLEDLYPIRYPRSITTGGGEGELIGELIALIKGEQND